MPAKYKDGCVGMFQPYHMNDFFPVRGIIANRHMPGNQATACNDLVWVAPRATEEAYEQEIRPLLDCFQKPFLLDHIQGRLHCGIPIQSKTMRLECYSG